MNIFKELVDRKTAKILEIFANNKEDFFHLSMIANKSRVPISTSFRILEKLVMLNIIEEKKVGKIRIYRLSENQNGREMGGIFRKK